MKENMKEYRQHLVQAEQKAQEDFDKTVIALSGGALGVSFTFIKDIIRPAEIVNVCTLGVAWSSWCISLVFVLLSYFFSHLSLRKAIDQVDKGIIHSEYPGGAYARITGYLNAIGAILFILGLGFMIYFGISNLGG